MQRIITRGYYKISRDGSVGRKTAKATLLRGRAESSNRLMLLPPWVGVSELRIMLGLSYESCFELLGVKTFQKKYYWSDHEGREFESAVKRKVLVPFETAARAAQTFKLQPRLLDVEPELHANAHGNGIPVAVVLGHINHGKTSLLDTISSTNTVEPGGITQGLRAFTLNGLTFIDTPGHETFDVSRGRATEAADVAVVIVSTEKGAEKQTSEVLRFADEFKTPVVFAINKVDVPLTDAKLTMLEISSESQKLHAQGLLSRDFSEEALSGVPISAKTGWNVHALLEAVHAKTAGCRFPLHPLPQLSVTAGMAEVYKNEKRRTDWQMNVDEQIYGAGLILEVEKSSGTFLHVVLKSGRVEKDMYFVAGTAYGKVKTLRNPLDGEDIEAIESVGVACTITGLQKCNGDCAPDDIILFLPQARAHRLSAYRQRIAELNRLQTSGPPLEVVWQQDSALLNPQTHAHEPRSRETVEQVLAKRPLFSKSELFEELKDLEIPDYRVIREIEKNEKVAAEEEAAKKKRIESIKQGGQSILVGRKSKRAKTTAHTTAQSNAQDEVYYTSRESFEEDAEVGTRKILSRQAKRDALREEEKQRKEELHAFEKSELNKIRGQIFEREDDEEEFEPLPQSRPVLPVILKTKTVGMFDALLDEIERIEERFGLSIPVVHGGIGSICQNDVVHAEVEKNYGFCPVYGVQVAIHPSAKSMADKHNIHLKTYEVFTEVLDDITKRCQNVMRKADVIKYQKQLRQKAPPTHSGM